MEKIFDSSQNKRNKVHEKNDKGANHLVGNICVKNKKNVNKNWNTRNTAENPE